MADAMPFQDGTLHVLLFLRQDRGSYHWALYHNHSSRRGWTYEIRNVGSDGLWMADHVSTWSVHKRLFLVGAYTVGPVAADRHETVHRIASSMDDELNVIPGLTCRVWLLRVLELLDTAGVVAVPSDIEDKVKAFGEANWDSASSAVKPRPIA